MGFIGGSGSIPDGSISSDKLASNVLSPIIKRIQENAINILINSASASALNDYEDMFLDIFNDTNGYDGSVDTINTDAIFYGNGNATTNTSLGIPNQTTGAVTTKCGMKFVTTASDKYINKFTKISTTTATTGYLLNASKSVLASASFVGDVCTFNYPIALANATNYYLAVDSGGASYTRSYRLNSSGGHSYPTTKTWMNWIAGLDSGNDEATYFADVISVELYDNSSAVYSNIDADKIVQTNAQSITANPIGHQVFCHNTLAGTATITYDISFDGGTTWETDQALNTKNVDVHDGDSMILKLNLNGTGASNKVTSKDYAVMLDY